MLFYLFFVIIKIYIERNGIMLFSIIVPIYNVADYLDRCLNSILLQSYKKYEVLLICDDSSDNSNDIAKSYSEKYENFKFIFEKNTGLSKAKNIGLSQAAGDYILFVDGDDFIEKDLLKTLINEDLNDYDILRFQAREIKDNNIIKDYYEIPFISENGIEAFNKILKYHYIENSWLYAYRREYLNTNNFMFQDGCIAEDYGLTPLIIARAKKVKSIDYIGYNYVQRKNSIMNSNDYSKKIKKMNDMLMQSNSMKLVLKNITNSENVINYLDDSLIYYSTRLNYKDFKHYNKILKKNGSFKHLKGETLKSRIRCFIIKKNAYLFYHLKK